MTPLWDDRLEWAEALGRSRHVGSGDGVELGEISPKSGVVPSQSKRHLQVTSPAESGRVLGRVMNGQIRISPTPGKFT
jgi:hypothetical protein